MSLPQTPFRGIVLAVGGLVSVVPLLVAVVGEPVEELPAAVIGAALLFSPYLVLARYGTGAAPLIGYIALVLIMAGTALLWILAISDPQGGLIAIYVLPAQWLAAWAVGRRRLVKRDRAR